MMLILGIDSQFAYIETVATVLSDAGWGERLPRWALSGRRPAGSRGMWGMCVCVCVFFLRGGGVVVLFGKPKGTPPILEVNAYFERRPCVKNQTATADHYPKGRSGVFTL